MHAPSVAYGVEVGGRYLAPYDNLIHPFFDFILPSFFALSGFLVAGSLLRNDLVSFGALRVIRIFPALMAEVIISALIIGPIFTALPLQAYFTDSRFYVYLLNMVGIVHFKLPGVFLDTPAPEVVNAQLWTVPIELQCYVSLIILALIGFHRRLGLFFLTMAFITVFVMANNAIRGVWLSFDSPPTARILILNFLFGVFFFLLKDKIVISKWLVLAALTIFVVLSYSPVWFYLRSGVHCLCDDRHRADELPSRRSDRGFELFLRSLPLRIPGATSYFSALSPIQNLVV